MVLQGLGPRFLEIADRRLQPWGSLSGPPIETFACQEARPIQLCVLSLLQPLREGRQGLWA